ncbi:invasion associated locus B family protein [Palleronia sp. LCG004]|uniref:invasion associated locus B family protein n=1 Tax=Palleronia sp. LCG004 TaxID=3079304 RepID=UPI002943546C|nr:invasion associated locus B family protein [Palleronia sp. LCG004]WOI55568.1 invasion associated locus B family protein [Palleronia sp. LCG004]
MRAILAGLIAGATLTGPAAAQDESTNRVAVETAWSVFVEDDPQECWSVSRPTETRNTRGGEVVEVTRGDILLFVTFRPGGGAGEVSFTGGYPFAGDSDVEVDIGGTTFQMFTDGEWAWPRSASDDAAIIAAMRGGAEAELTARSSRGTQTEDTFSLFGFTAALEEAENRCG